MRGQFGTVLSPLSPLSPRPRSFAVAAALAIVAGWPVAARAQTIDCVHPTDKEVRSLKFEGNATFSADELSARVLTTPSTFTRRYFGWFFHAGTARCIPDIGLSPDVEALKGFYKNNGFYATKVDTVVAPVSPTSVAVTFRINEGPPLLADTLAITGVDSVPDPNAILHPLLLKVGERAGYSLLYTDIDSITARLRNAGYPGATVFPEFDTNVEQHRAEVKLQVATGPRARFGTIAIERTGVTPEKPAEIDSTVVLHLLGFASGNWYSDRALADAQRNLYNLGVYRHVGIFLDTTQHAVDTLADVRVDVREDYIRQWLQEEGWGMLDCFRAEGTYTDKNFLDRAWRLDLTGRLSKVGYGYPTGGARNLCYRPYLDQDSIGSSKLNYYAGATFRQPTLFGGHWIPAYSAYTERRGEYREYLRTTFIGGEASATRNIGVRMPLRLGYSLEYAQTLAEPAVLCAVFNRCDQQLQDEVQGKLPIAVASASFQRATTDNPVDPRSGSVFGTEGRISSQYLGSNPTLGFYKATTDGSIYRSLTARTTFAVRLRGGFITGGTKEGGARLPPPQERLYAGGATSVRGFQQNELGPLVYLVDSSAFDTVRVSDTTVALVARNRARDSRTIPVGGNTLVVLNAELRIRDPFIPELLEYVPFVDVGGVWTREVGKNFLNKDALAVTPGIGARYFSPVGPIQVNVGYNPSKARLGQALWAAPVDPMTNKAPLLCVTAPGTSVVPVVFKKDKNGVNQFQQSGGDCPTSFIPFRSSNFISHLAVTLSLSTGF